MVKRNVPFAEAVIGGRQYVPPSKQRNKCIR